MAVLPILITGDPVLHDRAAEIAAITDDTRRLVADMVETMIAAPGVGLAAPQVGVAQRIFVYRWIDDGDVLHEGVAINPELWLAPAEPGDPDPEEESEGCLSVPGERFPLRRSPAAILQATNLDGERYEVRATGWLARIFQHEFDHLDGVLYVDRLSLPDRKAVAKVVKKQGWGVPGVSWLPGVDDLEG